MTNYEIYVRALELDKAGNWEEAHGLVDGITSREAARIHAYLHRKEGDEWNANYWYRMAGAEFYHGSLDEEWTELYDSFK